MAAASHSIPHPIPIDSDGRFCGYASVFGEIDSGGDMVMAGAFAKTLRTRPKERVAMLFHHDTKEPIGLWDAVIEDGYGLWVEGQLVPGVPRADALRALIERRAVDGLSIGYRTVRASRAGSASPRKLWQLDLYEISIVTFPMMEHARIVADRPARAAQPARRDAIAALGAAISVLRKR